MNVPPIPVPDPDQESMIFRTAFMRCFVTCSIAALALSLPLVIPTMLPIRSTKDFLLQLAFGVATGLITCAFLTILQIQILPVVANAGELCSTNFWGKPARVKWPEISSVKRTHFLTLPYLKISTFQKKNAIWLPLYLSDLKGFRAAVEQFAAPKNPLRGALEC